jgi:hypothetical protein
LIYPPELEIKETTDTASSASFLDLYLEFDDSGQLSTNGRNYANLELLIDKTSSIYLYVKLMTNKTKKKHNAENKKY